MCGRFVLTASEETIAETFRAHFLDDEYKQLLERYNIAPGTRILAVRQPPAEDDNATGAEAAAPADDEREALGLHWGLVPPWAEDKKIGNRMINARSETVFSKPAFRKAAAARRCLVPASGFYEWQRTEKAKQPFYFHPRESDLMAFAGLWERWKEPDGTWLLSCCLLTTAANADMEAIHHRMPVFLAPDAWSAWLDPATKADDLKPLLEPPPAERLARHPVSPAVNKPANDAADLLEPYDPDQQLQQNLELFDGQD